MSYPDKVSPITVSNMFLNLMYKAGRYGRALGIAKVTGTVVGVPSYPKNRMDFRNLFNRAIAISPDNGKPVLLVYENPDPAHRNYRPPTHDQKKTIANALFVLVKSEAGTVPRVCVNLAVFNAPDAEEYFTPATQTPTPTAIL